MNVERIERKTRISNPSRSTKPFAENSSSIVSFAQVESHDDPTTAISKCSDDVN